MKLSLSQRLVRFLKNRPGVFVSGGELERIATHSTTYKPSTVSRRLRELAEDGTLTREERKGTVYYAYQPTQQTARTVVVRNGIAYETTKEIKTAVLLPDNQRV